MITTFVVSCVLAALDAIFSLLPSWSWTPVANDGIFDVLKNANDVFPIGTLANTLLLMVGLLVAIRLWNFGVFVFHQFWGSD